MTILNEIFENKRLCIERLISYGFIEEQNKYKYSTKIADDKFSMVVIITTVGKITAKVIDDSTKEEYVLHNISLATGIFVGKVMEDYEKVLRNISEHVMKRKCSNPYMERK